MTHSDDRLVVVKFLKSVGEGKVQEGSTVIFVDT